MAWMINSSPSRVTSTTISSRFAARLGPEDELAVGVLCEVLDRQRVLDGVEDVVVGDAVAPGGRADLHTRLLYYEKGSPWGDSQRMSIPLRWTRSGRGRARRPR